MKKILVVAGLLCVLGGPMASAGEWQDAGAKTWNFGMQAFVVADKVLHWSWEIMHNRIVHPVVAVVTFGSVDLSKP
jgi:hypothetical protein